MRSSLVVGVAALILGCTAKPTADPPISAVATCPATSADTTTWESVSVDTTFAFRRPPGYAISAVRHVPGERRGAEWAAGDSRFRWALGQFDKLPSGSGSSRFVSCEEVIAGSRVHIAVFNYRGRLGIAARWLAASASNDDLLIEGFGSDESEQLRLLAMVRTVQWKQGP